MPTNNYQIRVAGWIPRTLSFDYDPDAPPAESTDGTAAAFWRVMDQIADFFCGTHLARARMNVSTFLDSSQHPLARAAAFVSLQRLAAKPHSDAFSSTGQSDHTLYKIIGKSGQQIVQGLPVFSTANAILTPIRAGLIFRLGALQGLQRLQWLRASRTWSGAVLRAIDAGGVAMTPEGRDTLTMLLMEESSLVVDREKVSELRIQLAPTMRFIDDALPPDLDRSAIKDSGTCGMNVATAGWPAGRRRMA